MPETKAHFIPPCNLLTKFIFRCYLYHLSMSVVNMSCHPIFMAFAHAIRHVICYVAYHVICLHHSYIFFAHDIHVIHSWYLSMAFVVSIAITSIYLCHLTILLVDIILLLYSSISFVPIFIHVIWLCFAPMSCYFSMQLYMFIDMSFVTLIVHVHLCMLFFMSYYWMPFEFFPHFNI